MKKNSEQLGELFSELQIGDSTTVVWVVEGDLDTRAGQVDFEYPTSNVGSVLAGEFTFCSFDVRDGIKVSIGSQVAPVNDRVPSVVTALEEITKSIDPKTAAHQKRVAEIACGIAGILQVTDELMEQVALGARVHDIGKLVTPANILDKPGRLGPDERKIIQKHSKDGYEILKIIDRTIINDPIMDAIATIALQHHKRQNGSGYPEEVPEDDILKAAKIVVAADVYDALVSKRPYKDPIERQDALEILRDEHLDQDVVDACFEFTESLMDELM